MELIPTTVAADSRPPRVHLELHPPSRLVVHPLHRCFATTRAAPSTTSVRMVGRTQPPANAIMVQTATIVVADGGRLHLLFHQLLCLPPVPRHLRLPCHPSYLHQVCLISPQYRLPRHHPLCAKTRAPRASTA